MPTASFAGKRSVPLPTTLSGNKSNRSWQNLHRRHEEIRTDPVVDCILVLRLGDGADRLPGCRRGTALSRADPGVALRVVPEPVPGRLECADRPRSAPGNSPADARRQIGPGN